MLKYTKTLDWKSLCDCYKTLRHKTRKVSFSSRVEPVPSIVCCERAVCPQNKDVTPGILSLRHIQSLFCTVLLCWFFTHWVLLPFSASSNEFLHHRRWCTRCTLQLQTVISYLKFRDCLNQILGVGGILSMRGFFLICDNTSHFTQPSNKNYSYAAQQLRNAASSSL